MIHISNKFTGSFFKNYSIYKRVGIDSEKSIRKLVIVIVRSISTKLITNILRYLLESKFYFYICYVYMSITTSVYE